LLQRSFTAENIKELQPLFSLSESQTELFENLKTWLKDSEIGILGVNELESIWQLVDSLGVENPKIAFDPSLARGLSYYTGAIFEVKALGVSIGSISGGGRYDNLTGTFGMPGLSGVGISLGVDRIFDVMEELNIFPTEISGSRTKVMVTNFGPDTLAISLEILTLLRKENINAEIYPENSKIKKQFEYADKKQIPFVIILGSEEIEKEIYNLKDMKTGEQVSINKTQLLEKLHV
jgi:histidyl-tRNA synthetase